MGKKSAEYVGKPRSDLRSSFLQPSVPVVGAGAVGVATIALVPADRRPGSRRRTRFTWNKSEN